MAKKTGRPAFPVPHRTMNVYLPADLHARLQSRAQRMKVSRSALIRHFVTIGLNVADDDDKVRAFMDKVLRS